MRFCCATLAVVVSVVQILGQSTDASPLLTAVRQALGGDAALSGVSSFSVSGSLARNVGPATVRGAVEITCALPDKFVRQLDRSISRGPLGTVFVTDYDGFSGDSPIRASTSSDPSVTVYIPPGPPPTTPAEVEAERLRGLAIQKHRFVEIVLPLFATSLRSYPVDFVTSAPATLPSGPADVLEVAGADGFKWRMFIDRSSHLPVKLTWMDRPVVIMSSSSVIAIGPGRQSAATSAGISGDPSTGMPAVEWQMAIGDYRIADGLKWPHRFTTTISGREMEELRVDRFKINPKIDAKKFTLPRS